MADSIKISLDIATQAADTALRNLRKTTQDVDKTFEIFKGNFAAGIAVDAIKGAFNALKGAVGTLIDEAAASEQAIQNLNIALKSTGLFTPKASQDFQDFAAALQATSIYSDEAVLASSSLLLSLTSLSKEGVHQATRAAADLAATLNIDLGSATELISKAVNGNTIGFKKIGISIQSADTDSGRLANTLKALSSQQGAAAAATETFAGALAKAKNQQSETFEAVGKLITQHPIVIAGIKGVSAALTASADFITKNKETIVDLATALAITVSVATAAWATYTLVTASAAAATVLSAITIVGGLGLVSGSFAILSAAASAAWAIVTAPVTLVVAAIAAVSVGVYLLVKNFEAVKAAAYDALAATIEFAAKGVELFSESKAAALREQAKGFREQAGSIREAAQAAKDKAASDATNDTQSDEQRKKEAARLAEAQKEAKAHSTFLIENERITFETLSLMQEEQNQAMTALGAVYLEETSILNDEYELGRTEKFNAAALGRLSAQQEFDRQELELQIAKQLASAQAETDDVKRREALRTVNDKAAIERLKLSNKQEVDTEKLKNDSKKKLDAEALAAKTNTVALFVGLQNSSNKELAAIGKAAALVQLAIATPTAVGQAFAFGTASGGPILGGVFAGIALAAMLAQAAQVAGVNFEAGGIVPGNSFTGDNVRANVNSGEMILNRQQQAELFNVANGSGGGDSGLRQQVAELASGLKALASQPLIVNVNGRELFNITREELASGRAY